MANILVLSNSSWCPSGYGKQAAIWTRKWRELGHNPAIVAFHGLQGAPLTDDGGIVTYPNGDDPFAQELLPGHYGHHKADLLITLMDAWVLDGARLRASGMNVAHWMPVDCQPLGHMDRKVLADGGGRPVAMSKFGQRILQEQGHDALYVPHGIDTQNVFKPDAERDEWRERLGLGDRFVVGMHAANTDPLRKGYAEGFAAFAKFRKRHPDAILVVHARVRTRSGVDLKILADDLGIGDAVKISDEYLVSAGMVTDADIARWLSLCDVLLNCAYGEGFGLTPVEAQSCGTPVIVTDCSSMTEICGAGWKVPVDPVDDMFWNRGHSARWYRPRPSRIAAALEKAYKGAAGLREKAREFAVANYDADVVLRDYWKPVLDQLLAAKEAPKPGTGGGIFAKTGAAS